MALMLKELYVKTKNTYRLSLRAGKNGMYHPVSWVYYTEDASTIDFIRGGELAMTTGMNIVRNASNTGIDDPSFVTTYFTTLIKNLQTMHAAGLIINTGRYVKAIPEEIVTLCDMLDFPLFTMPWEIHMIDLMEDFGNRIVDEKKEHSTITQCFYNLLFQPEKFRAEDLHRTNFENANNFGIIIAELSGTKTSKNYTARYLDFTFTAKLGLNNMEYCWFVYEKKIVFITTVNPEYIAEQIYKICCTDSNFREIKLGVSDTCTKLSELTSEYNHAQLAFSFSEQSQPLVFYRKLGIYRILGEIRDIHVLQQMYDDTLGKMKIIEKTKRDDYLKTLRLYLESGSKVQQTADENSLHRNTVNYRIRKIRDILGYDLQDGQKNFLILNALYIKEILEKKQTQLLSSNG